jgi:hypothetical protein
MGSSSATLRLTVTDEAGRPIAFRVQAFRGGRIAAKAWADGNASLSLAGGRYTILVRHGFDYDAMKIEVDLGEGVADRVVTLRRRYDLRSLGWYCGESHMHGQHSRSDQAKTFADARLLAEANGLDYVQIAQAWTPDFAWLPVQKLDQMAREASTPQVAVNWNLESPKCYMGPDDGGEGGNLHCYGHGCTLGLKALTHDEEFWFSGPNFRIIQEIHRQNAVVMLGHPARFWFNKGNFVSNWASEMAFDYVAGQGDDGVDILKDGAPVFFQHERVWWNLLNMGYKVAGTANSDGSIADGSAGRFRTYTRISGAFSWEKIADAMRRGACVASSGPMVLFQVDGQDPGAEFLADGRRHRATLKVWSSPLPDEMLVCIQVIRNGEIVQAWDLRNLNTREWAGEFELCETGFAWYAIRVISTCRDPQSLAIWRQPAELYEIAVANPVYFLPKEFRRPAPAKARVTLRVTDEVGNPLAASVSVVDVDGEIGRHVIDNGHAILEAPATAILIIRAAGYAEAKRDLYMDSPVFEYCRNLNGFYTPEAWNHLREMLGTLRFDVRLAQCGHSR